MTNDRFAIQRLDALGLTESDASQVGRTYWTYSSRTGISWLLPAEPELYRPSLNLYAPYTFGGYLRRLAMRVGLSRTKVKIETPGLAALEDVVARALGQDAVRLAFVVNNASPLGKGAILLLRPDGHALAIAKFAEEIEGVTTLLKELDTLKMLAETPGLQTLAPRPITWLRHMGAGLLIMTAGPKRKGPSKFSEVHQSALMRVQDPFLQRAAFRTSSMWTTIVEGTQQLESSLSELWNDRYAWALNVLSSKLGDQVVSLTLAHRDFAPWNTRQSSDNLFIFDWETASLGYTISYDYFHFHFMTALLLDRKISRSAVDRWIGVQSVPNVRDATAVSFLAYLVDLGVTYHRNNVLRGRTKDDEVLRQVGVLIDSFQSQPPSGWLSGA